MHDQNLNRADLNLLIVFDAVAQTRSVTAAADALSLSQPAVSHALKRLRTLMRDPLFVRGRDGLVLTPRAEGNVANVKAVLAAVGRILTTKRFEPATSKRSFRFAASDYAMMTLIPGVVRLLRTEAPNTYIEVAYVDSNFLSHLEKGKLDMAFVGVSSPAGPFKSQVLFQEHFVGLIGRSHPLAVKVEQDNLTLTDYLAYPHVKVTFGNSRPSAIDVKLAELGKSRHVAMVTPNFAASLACLDSTDLIASLPFRLASIGQQLGLLSFSLPISVPDYPYLMNWHQRSNDDPAFEWLRNKVTEAAASMQAANVPRRKARSVR